MVRKVKHPATVFRTEMEDIHVNGVYSLVNKHNNGKSQVSIGNRSSIRVHFPASYVSLPECTLEASNPHAGLNPPGRTGVGVK